MQYKEYQPRSILRSYVQCYFTCESETTVLSEDNIYASGSVEIMFNLGHTSKQTWIDQQQVQEPLIQLWGQTVQPLQVSTVGKHAMFGIRFYPHAAACFLNERIDQFNDRLLDMADVAGKKINLLHEQLMETNFIPQRIALVETFLLQQLLLFEKKAGKAQLVHHIMQELRQDDFFDNLDNVANRYGISSRYLQKLFVQYSGLSPNLFSKINRFRKSLQLVSQKQLSLTAVAHQCGYFDQSHFIKDFRYFTGAKPSAFELESSTDLLASLQN
ncbi:DUF6597 domain-containing transcriptional factor [Ferruginibacter sp.]